jgi:prepilin-type N-terminal cleavage/methylation domain-containing protein
MKTLLKDKSGFTLVEMLIVVALLGIVMTGVYEFMSTSNAFDAAIGEENDYQNLATNVMQAVRTQLSDAEGVKAVSIDSADVDDEDSYEAGYTYMVGNESGGYTVYVCSEGAASGSKVLEKKGTSGNVAESKRYKAKITYQTSAGNSEQKPIGGVYVSVVSLDDTGAEVGVVYELSSSIVLRSSETGSGNSIRFKTPTTTP